MLKNKSNLNLRLIEVLVGYQRRGLIDLHSELLQNIGRQRAAKNQVPETVPDAVPDAVADAVADAVMDAVADAVEPEAFESCSYSSPFLRLDILLHK